ncbi:DNA binding domain-containing protein, excisionase family [Chryseolinea serpens]|uniref:DNA binding domain-containing protein, excisionase family n=1 Tax=Chryseolinea serpens TaxID=947013 RepID=A0A1M5MI02_9BACT|nr:helix-turn-helix domain-containing protein [Chryseolinea serpens]SHG76787.1 DNA binding domain-containing protein, excisionase family [Chryseolinea serpens]
MKSQLLGQMTIEEFKILFKETYNEVLEEKRTGLNTDSLLNTREAALLLNLEVATLYDKTSQRLIPHYKRGKKVLFKKSELLACGESEVADHLFPFCPDHQFSDDVTTQFRHHLTRNESSNQGVRNLGEVQVPQVTLAGHALLKQRGQWGRNLHAMGGKSISKPIQYFQEPGDESCQD